MNLFYLSSRILLNFDFSPYKWTSKVKLPDYNYKRVAAVWMDNYKNYYFDRLGTTGASVEDNVGDFGDVSDRISLRESLQCENFEWYLKNQMPHFLDNKIIGAGEIRNFHQQFCLDQQDTEHNVGLPVLVFDCHGLKGNQYWYYRQDKTISRDYLCMGKRRKGSKNDNHVELGKKNLVAQENICKCKPKIFQLHVTAKTRGTTARTREL